MIVFLDRLRHGARVTCLVTIITPPTVTIASLRIMTYPLSRGPPIDTYIIYNM